MQELMSAEKQEKFHFPHCGSYLSVQMINFSGNLESADCESKMENKNSGVSFSRRILIAPQRIIYRLCINLSR
jgi:hypothetical protein